MYISYPCCPQAAAIAARKSSLADIFTKSGTMNRPFPSALGLRAVSAASCNFPIRIEIRGEFNEICRPEQGGKTCEAI